MRNRYNKSTTIIWRRHAYVHWMTILALLVFSAFEDESEI